MAVTLTRLANAMLGTLPDAVYTVPTGTVTRIDAAVLTNTDTSVQTVTVYLVLSGGGATATNTVMSAQQIAPGQSLIIKGVIGQVLRQGGTLQAQATTANTVNIYASGIEVV